MKRSSGPRKTANLSESVHWQLSMYALAASAAGVGMLSLAQPSEAKVIYTPAHQIIGPNSAYPLDLNHDGVIDFYIRRRSQTFTSGYPSFTDFLAASAAKTKSKACIEGYETKIGTQFSSLAESALKRGAQIPNGKLMLQSRGFMLAQCSADIGCTLGTRGQWGNVRNRYLGLKFEVNGKVHYGWARLNVGIIKLGGISEHLSVLLTGYAYETIPNKPIIAGKTKGPEATTVSPASLGHLAAGASAIPAWRVKQTAATTH